MLVNQSTNFSYYILSAQYLAGSLKTMMDQPKYILTARLDNNGKLEAAIIKKVSDRITLRLNAMYPNSDINYSQLNLDVDIEGKNLCKHRFISNLVPKLILTI